jgi:multidrug efflux pump subunit AcrA (membrane-fusion protein)
MKQRFLLLLLLLLIVTLTGCTGQKTGAARPPTPTPVPTPAAAAKTTYRVERGEVVREAKMSGRIVPVEERELFFRTSGRVRQVYAEQDMTVKAGQLLADLEGDALQRELTSTQLELERTLVRAEAAEKARQNNVQRAEVNLAVAKLNLEAAIAQDPAPRLTQAQAELEKADLALKKAQADYDGVKWRGNIGALPQSLALQQATIAHTQARAAYDLALQAIDAHEYDLKIKTQQVRLAQISLDELKEQGPDPLLKNDVARAQLNVEKLRAAISDTQIIAPFDGELVSLTIVEGDAVEAYKPVAVIVNPAALEVSANPTSAAQSELAEGMIASVTFISKSGPPLQGVIRRMPYLLTAGSTALKLEDRDQSVRIRLAVGPEQGGYTRGDVVEITIALQRRENTLWLPPEAIRTFQDRRFVVIQEGNAQRRANLKIGIEGQDRVEILEGVSEGQVVLAQP